MEQVLAALAELRPDAPDVPRLARTSSTPIGTEAEQAQRRLAPIRHPAAALDVGQGPCDERAAAVLDIVDERAAELARPLLGVTTDGTLRARPAIARGPEVSTQPITDAALAFLQALTPEQRERACFAMDAVEWRTWINVHMNHFRHGVMLEDLPSRCATWRSASCGPRCPTRGFHHARSIMRLNELLAELTGDHEAFGEWPYFVSIFGTPGGDEPWGWQIDGHHLCVNVVVLDDRIVMTPTFMGAEPRRVHRGPLRRDLAVRPGGGARARPDPLLRRGAASAGDHLPVDPPRRDLRRTCRTWSTGGSPAGAFHDNLVAPYQGVAGAEMTDAQRRLLLALAATYVGWIADEHAAVRMSEVDAHLDETWFSWYGGTGDESPFYYRVHSPVILIEFDHHPGVAFDNEVPSRHHVHTVVRTPNGGDYGADLLRQHHDQFDHRHGDHATRR